MKHQGYFTRALKASDPRYARIFQKLGYRTTEMVADEAPVDIDALRDQYEKVLGKRPFNGWSAETLAEKIAEKQAQG
ncbi:hypothetical protein OSJ57_17635 [Sphingomonas sp. HH69]